MDVWREAVSRPDRGSGFTLLEVLVAFTILGLAMVGLFGAFSDGLVGGLRAREVSALILAGRSKISEVGRSVALAPGELSGELPDGTPWTLTISEVEPLGADPLAQLVVRAHHVTIELGSGEAPSVRLETTRLEGAQ